MATYSTGRRRRAPEMAVEPLPGRLALTVPEAAYLLGISVRTCWDVVKSVELPSFKIGARRLIARSAVEEMVAAGARPRSVTA
jgi:excisionase family DNA binding protein